ncbi:hypothetical protein [Pseudoduganella ginsengisoli]|uniref:Uncharacterized protein n=1 Tax=Pseudoduganella ginsengisoli TaxID=1462440 RepID=A0A6L6Q490_9BURK|nr:hypothetical protein [Pseudoduganella ginsengisoli]MTW03882.1 hypothetical protein [Pseudoduganella ginsengisoli]
MQKFLHTFIVALMCLCAASTQASELQDVSMIQLIANPQLYDGKPVRVMAFLNLEFEGNALYLHREDFDKSLLSNAVWISLDDQQIRASKKFSGGYVLVEGVFSAKDRGNFGIFPGSIQKVTRLQSWERKKK